MIVDGHMQYLFDEKGRRYLDVSCPTTRPFACWRLAWRLAWRRGERSAARAGRQAVRLTWFSSRAVPQAFAGIVTVSVGHCHPEVNAAVVEQTQRLQHTTTIYLHNQARAAARCAGGGPHSRATEPARELPARPPLPSVSRTPLRLPLRTLQIAEHAAELAAAFPHYRTLSHSAVAAPDMPPSTTDR